MCYYLNRNDTRRTYLKAKHGQLLQQGTVLFLSFLTKQIILGHCCSKQWDRSLAAPGQGRPPYWFGGLSQLRWRVFVPLPHVTEQADHASQEPHVPFTVSGNNHCVS